MENEGKEYIVVKRVRAQNIREAAQAGQIEGEIINVYEEDKYKG